MIDPIAELLIENHAEFLATHRGQIRRCGDSFECVSDRRAFAVTFALSVDDAIAAADRGKTLYVPAWIHEALDGVLDAGHEETHSLTYMALRLADKTDRAPDGPADFTVRRVRGPGIEEFAAAQVAGFCETRETLEEFGEWMRAADRRNADSPRQHFHVGYASGEPVACALVMDAASLAGIFAVATLPAYRRRGLSRALMHAALADARARGFGMSGLSVLRGSLAERSYLRLGYRRVFRMHVLAPRDAHSRRA